MLEDENAVVLDFLLHGKSTGFKQMPIAQVIGTQYFTLLEVVPKPNVNLKAGQQVYIGKGERKEIELIKRRISFKDLTSSAVAEIDKTIEHLVSINEARFVEFFNNSRSITIKRHQLELLPGLGKKHMLSVLGEREKAPFTSFKDIEGRVPLMPNVPKTVVKRIIEELDGEEEKHFLFVKPFVKKEEDYRGDRRDYRPKRF